MRSIEELMERRNQIVEELEADGADLDALEAEMREINSELEARKKELAQHRQREAIRNMVADGTVPVTAIRTFGAVEPVRDLDEIRSSAAYANAYAEYIKHEDDAECRALLTELAEDGTLPVPTVVYETVKTAWAKEGIMAKVPKSYVKGILKVGFEVEGTDAVIHPEGSGAVDEEELTLGVVTLTPVSIKKWISISDEAYDLKGEAFLTYIYNELTYKIAKKAADTLIAKIIASPASATATAPGVPVIEVDTPTMATVAEAIGNLSDAANNPVILMNKLTWSRFKAIQYANGYGADPFEGLEVLFNDTIKSYDAAGDTDPYLIVGDLDEGTLANLPNGEGINIKIDDKTLMTSDMIRILGREYIGIEVVGDKAFVKVIKGE